jgi:hypothetical protein
MKSIEFPSKMKKSVGSGNRTTDHSLLTHHPTHSTTQSLSGDFGRSGPMQSSEFVRWKVATQKLLLAAWDDRRGKKGP